MKNLRLPENFWTSPTIQNRLEQEAAFEAESGCAQMPLYWAVVPEADNTRSRRTIEFCNFQPTEFNPAPHILQMQFAGQLMIALNKELHMDGVWIVAFTHPPGFHHAIRVDGDNCWGRMVMLWLDQDGDPQFVAESEAKFVTMVEYGQQYYMKLAHNAWQQYDQIIGKRALKGEFGVQDGQTRMDALESLSKG
jgi:hypothetical protein